MQFTIGSGNNRKTLVVGGRKTMNRKQHDKVREDAKALLLRPATFSNHSGAFTTE